MYSPSRAGDDRPLAFVLMSENVTLVEDGVAPSKQRSPSRPSWVLGVAGFVLGLGLGVLVVGPAPEATSSSTPLNPPDGEPPLIEPEDEVTPPGLAEVVPNFPDALVAVAVGSGSALQRIFWPLETPMQVSALTGGDEVLLDSTAQHVALSTTVPEAHGTLLSMGRFNSIEPVAQGVASFAWHDSTPGWLGYTLDPGGSTMILTTKGEFSPSLVTDLVGPPHSLVGWGDWGWVLQGEDDVVFLEPGGVVEHSEPGVALATHRSGTTLVKDVDGLHLVSLGAGTRPLASDVEWSDDAIARFSPDGGAVAISGPGGLQTLDVSSGQLRQLSNLATQSMAWSSDSRFLLTATGAGVVIFDVEGDQIRPILRDYPIVEVGVLPRGS